MGWKNRLVMLLRGEEGIDLQHRCESKHVLQCAMIWACYILPSWNWVRCMLFVLPENEREREREREQKSDRQINEHECNLLLFPPTFSFPLQFWPWARANFVATSLGFWRAMHNLNAGYSRRSSPDDETYAWSQSEFMRNSESPDNHFRA